MRWGLDWGAVGSRGGESVSGAGRGGSPGTSILRAGAASLVLARGRSTCNNIDAAYVRGDRACQHHSSRAVGVKRATGRVPHESKETSVN